MLPRYELNARLPERGTDLILKDERRLILRSALIPYPASPPRFSTRAYACISRTYI